MTKRTGTRSRALPLIGAAVLLGVVGLAIIDRMPGDLPAQGQATCAGKIAKVVFGVELSTARPVRIQASVDGRAPANNDVSTARWFGTEPSVKCPNEALLSVDARDIWGGKTHCWIAVDDRRVVEERTTGRTPCLVNVLLEPA